MNFKWTDARELGVALARRFPDTDPLSLRLADVGRMVRETPGFGDEPARATTKILQAIRDAWFDEVSD